MTTLHKTARAVGAVIVLVAALAAVSIFCKSPPPVSFSCVSVSNSSNTTLISIGITNHSSSGILYFVGDPVLKSNGVWGTFQHPMRTRLVKLRAGQTTTQVVTAMPSGGEARVPVLWGFEYRPTANLWQEVRGDVTAYLRTHDFSGQGALYTNYVTGIKL